MKKLLAYAMVALIAAGFSGCAGIVNGKTQNVTIDSNVKGATIELIRQNGKIVPIGVTPYAGGLPRSKSAVLVVKKEGYEEKQYVLGSSMSVPFVLNILWGYFSTFSTTTDMANETAWDYSNSNIYVNLEPVKGTFNWDFQKDTDIKRFVMMNYSQLVNDLAQSKGEYLDALVQEHLGVSAEKAPSVVKELRRLLSESNHNVATFGEKVAAYYFAS